MAGEKTINKVTAVYKLIRSQTEQTHVINKKNTGIRRDMITRCLNQENRIHTGYNIIL